MNNDIVKLHDLEEMMDRGDELWSLVGKTVEFTYDDGEEPEFFPIVTVPGRGIGLLITEACPGCGAEEEGVVCRTNQSWCLFCARDGSLIADLRQRPYFCSNHTTLTDQDVQDAFHSIMKDALLHIMVNLPEGTILIVRHSDREQHSTFEPPFRPAPGRERLN